MDLSHLLMLGVFYFFILFSLTYFAHVILYNLFEYVDKDVKKWRLSIK